MKKLIILIVAIATLTACNSSEKKIHGKWLMHQVIQDGKDVSAEHNPEKDRYFIMNNDGTFESGGQPYGKNTGKYVFDTNAKTLFIDSDLGPEDDSNWNISFEDDKMIWQGYGTAWAERFQVIHKKVKD